MKKALVVGLGVSGVAAAKLLSARGFSVIAVDQKLKEGPWSFYLEKEPFDWTGIELTILSPGIPQSHPVAQEVQRRQIPLIGEVELGFQQIENRCIGVTGSNGKTTTVSLLSHLIPKTRALGNIGTPLSDYAMAPNASEILAVELSSFQLETLATRRLDVALVLNVTPNHLDRYPSMADYAAAKLSIQKGLKSNGHLIVSSQVMRDFSSLIVWDDVEVIDVPPFEQNREMAFAAARYFQVDRKECEDLYQSFQRPLHRLEFVAEKKGVAYYNDSKATSVDAVIYAVSALKGPLVLLVGGKHKGASYAPWREAFQGKVKKVISFGAAASLIEEELRGFCQCAKVETMEQAVQRAALEAKEGEAVLLSPGCSSFDQFQNYEQRGQEFKRIVGKV